MKAGEIRMPEASSQTSASAIPSPGRQFWYIACPSSQLQQQPLAARVFDVDLALFRDAQGRPGALLDRCAHRAVRLSLGRVTAGNLACGYHGWQYARDGQCAHIPSLCAGEGAPHGVAVTAYPCVEQDGYVWVWTGEGPPIPSVPNRIEEFDGNAWLQGTVLFNCSACMLIENQFDAAHPAFAHEGTHPAYFFSRLRGMPETEFEVRMEEQGFAAFIPVVDPDQPIPDEPRSLTRLELPARVYIRQVAEPLVNFRLVLHVVPTGPQTCRLEWLQHNPKGAEGITWVEKETRLIEQDRLLLESAQPAYGPGAGFSERSVPADFVTMLVRRALRASAQPDWRAELRHLPGRRIVRLRS
jgi:phenylpropionate dioxygenase-like ring-hydroxylating dioxygenase large terminal subunit